MGGKSEHTTLDPLGWGGGSSSWAGAYAVNSCGTIAVEDRRLAGRSARPTSNIKSRLREVEHVPALHCSNWAIWKRFFGGG